MENLLTMSVAVIPLHDLNAHKSVANILLDIREIKNLNKAIADLNYPISPEHPTQIVLGGYGATGLPSLSHQPRIRALRQAVYYRIAPQLANIHPNRRLELLFDRFSIRRKGSSVSGESWHRDVGPKSEGDIIYGGWLNLDPPGSPPQYFSCIPGNVLSADIQDITGFATFDKTLFPELNAAVSRIAVPPGCIILFDQTIAHKITGAKTKETSYRLYFGWRITDSTVPLHDKASIISQQLMPPLPSGQKAPMYGRLHWSNWKPRVIEFTELFKPEFLEKTSGIISKFMPGLVETGHAFEPYTQEESDIFYPQLLSPNPNA
jgi:hypothetical protein